MIKVCCKHKDCIFSIQDNACTHSDKKYHMYEENCPLYRPDWNRTNKQQIEEIKKRFNIGKK